MRSAYRQMRKWTNHIHGKPYWESVVAKTQRNEANLLLANTLIFAVYLETAGKKHFQGFPQTPNVVPVQRLSKMVQAKKRPEAMSLRASFLRPN